jgi:hypothetical protein
MDQKLSDMLEVAFQVCSINWGLIVFFFFGKTYLCTIKKVFPWGRTSDTARRGYSKNKQR